MRDNFLFTCTFHFRVSVITIGYFELHYCEIPANLNSIVRVERKQETMSRPVKMSLGHFKIYPYGNSLVLHCASLLRTIFASLARAHERVHVQNVRDFPQTKLDSEINPPFLLNEHGDPRLFFFFFFFRYLLRTV